MLDQDCTNCLCPEIRTFVFKYISNKMQRYTVYFIWKLLYMFRVVPSPNIRDANNCICSIWYLSHRYCYLPLSWRNWNWFECALFRVVSSHIIRSANNSIYSIWYLSHLYCYLPLSWRIWNWFECAVHTQTSSKSSTIAADSSNGVTNTRCCRYSCLRS